MKMSIQVLTKESKRISMAATIILFLALIRCAAEPFRLQYYSARALTFLDIKPFVLGSLVTGLALLTMTIFSFFGKFKMITAICLLTIVALLLIKRMYLIS
jgi:hypothetical protein